MAIATLPGALVQCVPDYNGSGVQQGSVGTLFLSTFTFDAATDVLAIVTRVPQSGTLTALEFRTGTVSTAGADFDMGLYQIDGATGLPTTTPYVTNSNGTVTVATSDDNVFKSVAINSGTGVSVTQGDLVGVVLSVVSGTPNTVQVAAPSVIFRQMALQPYRVENTTGALAKVASSFIPCFVWNYGGTYVFAEGASPVTAGNYQTPGNGAERGLRFQLPVPFSLKGVKLLLGNIAAGADFEVRLYSGTAPYTTEQTVSMDGENVQSATNDGLVTLIFPASETLAANTTYFIAVKQTTANVVQTTEWTVPSAGYMAAMPGGAAFQLCNRDATAVTNNTSFTVTDTIQPSIFLLLDGLDDGAGGGGGGGQRVIGG